MSRPESGLSSNCRLRTVVDQMLRGHELSATVRDPSFVEPVSFYTATDGCPLRTIAQIMRACRSTSMHVNAWVQSRLVAGLQHCDDRWWRQHGDRLVARPRSTLDVPAT